MADLPPVDRHTFEPTVSFDGGELDCGNGLLLLIRKHIDPLDSGLLLEVISLESSVEADLPAWCRLTKNDLVSWCKHGNRRSFLICKGKFDEDNFLSNAPVQHVQHVELSESNELTTLNLPGVIADASQAIAKALAIEPLSVMGIGSWPRPAWLLRSLHEWLQHRIGDEEFQSTADDAVRLAVDAQLRAGVDVLTDGEQRRDNYASFVGRILDNCQLIPLTDLLPLVDDPKKFESELKSLAVPAEKVRHPAVFGKLHRSRPLAVHEGRFLKKLTDKPLKIALPGPYLLARTMWLECVSDKAYESREALAVDIVRILREEVAQLLADGISMIQLDEPVLTEVVFGGPTAARTFMCGALSERGSIEYELEFAQLLINQVVRGFPYERLGLHICRGNWTPDESVALSGSYEALLPLLQDLKVGTLFLEFCTERAGDIAILKELPQSMRIGLGVVNQKSSRVETVDEVLAKVHAAISIIGRERILLNPDCGFATFADTPIASAEIAEAKLRVVAQAAARLKT